jgi:hypothetical protein
VTAASRTFQDPDVARKLQPYVEQLEGARGDARALRWLASEMREQLAGLRRYLDHQGLLTEPPIAHDMALADTVLAEYDAAILAAGGR